MKINYYTPVKNHLGHPNKTLTGYAEMGKLIWPTLAVHDTKVSDFGKQPNDAKFDDIAASMMQRLGTHGKPDIEIVNMVPSAWNNIWKSGKKIGYTTFETSALPAAWVKISESVDQIWTTSNWNKSVMEASGVKKPIFVIPPIAIKQDIKPIPADKFTFLATFQWSQRKNPAGLIQAFSVAFDGRDDVQLVIKTHSDLGDAFLQKEIASAIASVHVRKPPKISLITGILSAEKIQKLYGKANAYVSLSHGEGWGLPAWEAALAGLPVLHTGWSAPVEFLPAESLIKYNLIPVGNGQSVSPFFEPGMWWANAHIDDAVDKLRAVANGKMDSLSNDWGNELLKKFSAESCMSVVEAALKM